MNIIYIENIKSKDDQKMSNSLSLKKKTSVKAVYNDISEISLVKLLGKGKLPLA